MEWIRRIGCFFGFHQYQPLKSLWFTYRQNESYIINDSKYLKDGESIITTYICLHCNKKREIKVNS